MLALPDTTRSLRHRAITVIPGDLHDRTALDRALRDRDVVVHLAGALPGSSPRDLRRVNVEGTRRLVDAATRAGSRRIVFAGSTAAYAPAPEWAWPLDERSRLLGVQGPMTYGRSKAIAERVLAHSAAGRGVDVVSLRMPIVYGIDAPFLRPLAELLVHGSPHALPPPRRWPLQWAHVDDAAAAIDGAVIRGQPLGLACNVAGAELFSFGDLSRMIREIAAGARAPTPLPPARRRRLKFDIGAARTTIGYVPQTDLSRGLAESL